MNILDIIIGGAILYGLIKGFSRGLIIEVTSLLSIVFGILGAAKFSHLINDVLASFLTMSKHAVTLLSFAITFICITFLVSWAGKILTKLLKVVALGFVNKLLGAVFGILKMILIMGILAYYFYSFNTNFYVVRKEVIKNSIFFNLVKEVGELVIFEIYPKSKEENPLKHI